MTVEDEGTFAEGFDEYILDCKSRNLRDGTLRHYSDSAKQHVKHIGEETLIKNISTKRLLKISLFS